MDYRLQASVQFSQPYKASPFLWWQPKTHHFSFWSDCKRSQWLPVGGRKLERCTSCFRALQDPWNSWGLLSREVQAYRTVLLGAAHHMVQCGGILCSRAFSRRLFWTAACHYSSNGEGAKPFRSYLPEADVGQCARTHRTCPYSMKAWIGL